VTEEDDIDGLAAEYVLGSLDAAERRQVDVRLQTDAPLAAAIAAWERDLAPLSDQQQGVTPPNQALDGILSRISALSAPPGATAEVAPLRRPYGRRWIAVAAGAGSLAASLVLAIGLWNYQQPTSLEHSKMDCGKLYKNFWEQRDPQSYGRLSSEQLAGVSRMALRAYDACQAGDEQDAKALLARLLERSGSQSPQAPSLPG
jgi:anti-sigma-K factor RskA